MYSQIRNTPSNTLFSIVWRCYFFGAGTIFLIPTAFAVVILLVGGLESAGPSLLAVVLIPLVLLVQGFLFGGIIVLGRSVYLKLAREQR